MSKKDGYSRPGLFGSINHYDSKGHKIGESRPGFFGGYNDYAGSKRPAGQLNKIFQSSIGLNTQRGFFLCLFIFNN